MKTKRIYQTNNEVKKRALLEARNFFGSNVGLAKAIGVTPEHVTKWINNDVNVSCDFSIIIE